MPEEIVRAKIVLEQQGADGNGSASSKEKDRKDDKKHKETTDILRNIGRGVGGVSRSMGVLAIAAGISSIAGMGEKEKLEELGGSGEFGTGLIGKDPFGNLADAEGKAAEETELLSKALQNQLRTQLEGAAEDGQITAEEMNNLLESLDELKNIDPKNTMLDNFFSDFINSADTAINKVDQLARKLATASTARTGGFIGETSREEPTIFDLNSRDDTNAYLNSKNTSQDYTPVPQVTESGDAGVVGYKKQTSGNTTTSGGNLGGI